MFGLTDSARQIICDFTKFSVSSTLQMKTPKGFKS